MHGQTLATVDETPHHTHLHTIQLSNPLFISFVPLSPLQLRNRCKIFQTPLFGDCVHDLLSAGSLTEPPHDSLSKWRKHKTTLPISPLVIRKKGDESLWTRTQVQRKRKERNHRCEDAFFEKSESRKNFCSQIHLWV